MSVEKVPENMSVRSLPDELQKIADNELSEVTERIPDDLRHLRDWIAKQPHLNCRTDDQWLLAFLRGCKFSLEQTKVKLDLYGTMKTLAPELLNNRDPLLPDIQEVLNRGIIVPLKNKGNTLQNKTIFLRYNKADPDKASFTSILKVLFMVLDVLLVEDDSIIIGIQSIAVIEDLNIKYVTQVNPGVIKKAATCIQSAYPIRLKAFYDLNVPAYYEMFHNLLKLFVKKKLMDRNKYFTGDTFESLCKILPLSMIPKDYGGDGFYFDEMAAEWKTKIESYRDWFLKDAEFCTDETKRPGKPMTSAEMFGVEGSFRKLNID